MNIFKKVLVTLPILLLLFTSSVEATTSEAVLDSQTAENSATPVVVENTEEKSTTSTNRYFELELKMQSQNAITKNIVYELTVVPKIDSPRTQITWDLPSVLTENPKHEEFVNLKQDQSYTYKVVVSPQREGVYDITANVTSWQNEVNYTNSVSSTVTLNSALIVQPVDSSYQVSLILFVVGGLGTLGLLLFIGYKMSDKVSKRLKIWLTPPY